jgi:hypothetical protein
MLELSSKPLVFLVFCLQPEGVHLLEGGVFGIPSLGLKAALDGSEAPGEFNTGGAKRVVRVELQLAGEGTEQKISEFLRTLGGLS